MAGKGQRRQRVERKNADLEHLWTCGRSYAIDDPGAISDADHAGRRRLWDVINAKQSSQLDRSADLLHAFTDRGHARILVGVDEAARQTPQAITGLNRSAADHHSAVRLDHDCCRDFGVMPEDEAVIRASLDLAAFDDSGHEGCAAVDAEVSPHY
jgi:hypothetical protein